MSSRKLMSSIQLEEQGNAEQDNFVIIHNTMYNYRLPPEIKQFLWVHLRPVYAFLTENNELQLYQQSTVSLPMQLDEWANHGFILQNLSTRLNKWKCWCTSSALGVHPSFRCCKDSYTLTPLSSVLCYIMF